MIAEHKGEIPIVVLLLPLMGGIFAGLNYRGTTPFLLWAVLIGLGLLFSLLGFGYKRLKVFKISWIGGVLITPLLLLAGWILTIQHNQLNSTGHFSKQPAQYLVVNICDEPTFKNGLVKFTASIIQSIDHDKIKAVNGSLLITIKDKQASNLFYGEQLLIPSNFTAVEPPYNPGEFNYKQYLANKNIFHQSFLYPGQYHVIKAGCGNPVIAYALQTRQQLVNKLKGNMHDTTAIAVASTLILGYKADLSNDVLQAYSKTGTIHILSVSGGHVAIIYILLAWMLGFLDNFKRGKLIKAVIIIVLIWGYALLTGFSPAVNRAALMISMVICGKTYSRYINTLNILAFSAFALLLYDPYLLMDVGFQLSYLAVAGLIIFQPMVYRWLSFKNRAANYLWNACSVSIAAQLITFPLSAFYFHQFPVYFLVSNLLILLPVVIIMYAGLFLLALPQITFVSGWLGYVLEHAALLMNKMLAIVEHIPYAAINKIWISRFEQILLYAIIVAAYYWLCDKQKWLIKFSLFALLVFSISISVKKFRADKQQSVTFLNLRKHTGIVFKNGDKAVIYN
ncbi:hypothetical protein A0256_15065 [Mucilaginibacter sp. PAMC 26640]|nr:hypothetical protein A0256_15065 [Mucilaginibacter sp. PAMC 26640]